MALTTQILQRTVFGDMRVSVVRFGFDSSYPTGGYAVTPSDLGMTSVVNAAFWCGGVDSGGYITTYKYDTGRIRVFDTGSANSPLKEVNNGTDLSSITALRMVFFGK